MSYIVTFRNKENNSSTSIELFSHYTYIHSKNSGEGKSYFYDFINGGLRDDSIEVTISGVDATFTMADESNIIAIVGNPNLQVIMIDEASMFSSRSIRSLNNSKHLFICITRAMPFKVDSCMDGLYEIDMDGEAFDIRHVEPLPIKSKLNHEFKKIVVEADKDVSEHQLLSVYLEGVQPAGGRDRLERLLRKTKEPTLVFTDLGNIASAYNILLKRSQQNPNMVFYDYKCFEQLLVESSIVGRLGNTGLSFTENEFDFLSVERYYERILEKLTRGTSISYNHHNPVLKQPYLDKNNFNIVFDGKSAEGIRDYISKYGDLT